jgi:16S rRNA (cytosine1402-N4)-methyltransferase|tara:strand:- start:522 stop:1541 length:1020 start_codon:yes stop_codon:yes gene_type:complete
MTAFKTSLEKPHYPVMLKEVIKICAPEKGGNFLDCTFGGGGYSKELLKYPNTKIIALDRDSFVETKATKIKKKYPHRFIFHNKKFSDLDKIINMDSRIDTIIFDLGMSTFQITDMSRGFSFKSKKKLDMKMGLSSISAEDIVNTYSEENLKLILKILGEEKEASRIVKNIIKVRKTKRISKVSDLVQIIEKSKKKNYSKKINVCTKTFQALRIFVNKETTELIEGIINATKILKPGGKIIIISFHSIEDKIVKFYFSNYSKNKSKPSRYFPEEELKQSLIFFEDYKNKFIRPSEKEILDNPPSRSAKLRYIVRNKEKFVDPKKFKNKFQRYVSLERIND